MHTQRSLLLAVLAAFTGVALAAEEPAVPPASDGPALKGTAQAIPESNVYDLLTKSETTLSAIYYGRDRQDQTPGSNNGDIHVNALNLGLNFKSGYAWDHLGFDAAAHAALRLNNGLGWSEVLYHDVNDKSDPSEEGRGKDKSTAVLSQAALKFRQNADGQGLSARLGYTPISIGTMGTSGGLQSHAYRGFEGKYKFGDFEVGYGWADQFRNEWDDRFRDITNSWEQGRTDGSKPKRIDYVNSIGLRYAPKDWFVDFGFGEGKDYRSNAQVAASYTWKLGDDSLTATGYYFTAKYKTALSGIQNPKNEWHASGSLSYSTGGLTLMGGYGSTHAPDSGELNFRLAPWANADNRNFIQTWGQLDDFVWDGTKVYKIGLSYDFGKIGVTGLSAGISANFASGMKNAGKADTKAEEVDFNVGYTVQSGFLKGASIGVYPAQLRTHGFSGKADRNDVKVIASYSKTF
ncbi:OprD family outer membrane porin [Chromobacterium amazonense]|uniref:OprD family outer membrane porin n=1 Tax=Chromobacterium amazonense TaxID=1382803 RepID=A0ABU8V7Z3_9NEIS|nr:OprD family outer membrane porin [Chromobacterium amazonense]MBM2885809.1 OprD family outer membrane porin [Chromobacterium amazonense]MDE1713840.1 OprD family outer membrane porin [Chromobacterium amazonense]MDQ4539462.1 OprD family outer membrane porin [Chromobacterium amazonense]